MYDVFYFVLNAPNLFTPAEKPAEMPDYSDKSCTFVRFEK